VPDAIAVDAKAPARIYRHAGTASGWSAAAATARRTMVEDERLEVAHGRDVAESRGSPGLGRDAKTRAHVERERAAGIRTWPPVRARAWTRRHRVQPPIGLRGDTIRSRRLQGNPSRIITCPRARNDNGHRGHKARRHRATGSQSQSCSGVRSRGDAHLRGRRTRGSDMAARSDRARSLKRRVGLWGTRGAPRLRRRTEARGEGRSRPRLSRP